MSGRGEAPARDAAAGGADGADHLVRVAAVALAGVGVLAGMAGAAVAGLLHQARTTAERIERAQVDVGAPDDTADAPAAAPSTLTPSTPTTSTPTTSTGATSSPLADRTGPGCGTAAPGRDGAASTAAPERGGQGVVPAGPVTPGASGPRPNAPIEAPVTVAPIDPVAAQAAAPWVPPQSPGAPTGPESAGLPTLADAALDAARRDGSFTPPTAGLIGGASQRADDAAAQHRLPRGDGVYDPAGALLGPDTPDSDQEPLRLAMLGDSTAVGFGCTRADELPGVMLARGLARAAGRPVELRTVGVVGVGAADLARQLDLVLPTPDPTADSDADISPGTDTDRPAPGAPASRAGRADVVVVVVGANDIRDKVAPHTSARLLGAVVGAATAAGVPVVVGTCPDFGVITAIPQPLRSLLRTWSHRLADQQAREVVRAGGAPVAIGQLVSPEFAGRPELFAADRFHPSGAGYARAVDALLPAVLRGVLGQAATPAG